MVEFDPRLVQRRLEDFRKNLLDISLRNRLINFRTRTLQGKPLEKVVEVYGEDPVEIYRILVTDGKLMSFTGKPDLRPAKKASSSLDLDHDDRKGTEIEAPEDKDRELTRLFTTADEAVDTTDLRLNTRDTVSALQRKLTKIQRDAKVAIEEQGVNVLFLALGSLNWFESDSSEEVRRAPLMMIPVTLERTGGGAFRLRWDGTDAGTNLSIAAKLKADFAIRLPEMPDELDIASYFGEVKNAVQSQRRWTLDRSAVALAFFSYAKYLMYRDLDSAGWPEDAKPCTHVTIGALLDGGFEENEQGIAEEEFLDPLRATADVCEVYDADASQTLAILEANTGRSMIIEGPPGTGKSQTITNLIAEGLGAGKKILFVAEKSAALDVVFRRLKEANLEDACLELHSNKANKREFYQELKKTVSVSSPKMARTESELKRLEEHKSALNNYTTAVNTPLESFDVSPRFAMGHLVNLGPEPSTEGRHSFEKMMTWNEQAFCERRDHINKLQEQLVRMGLRPADHPYFGCTLLYLLPADKEDIARLLGEAGRASEAFHRSANLLAETLRVGLPVRPADVDSLRKCATFVSHSPEIRGASIRADWDALEPILQSAIQDGITYRETMKKIGDDISPGAIELDQDNLQSVLRLRNLIGNAADEFAADQLIGLLEALDGAASCAFALTDASSHLATELGIPSPKRLWEIEPLASLAKRLGSAPDIMGMIVSAAEWKEATEAVQDALAMVRRFNDARSRFRDVLTEQAWRAEVRNDLTILEQHGSGFFRFLNSTYKNAMASSAAFFVSPPKDPLDRVAALRAVVEAKSAEEGVVACRGRLSALFGARWQGVNSDVTTLSEAASWITEAHGGGKIPPQAFTALEQGLVPSKLAADGDDVRTKTASAVEAFATLRKEIVNLGIRTLEEGTGAPNEKILTFILEVLSPVLAELRKSIPKYKEYGFARSLLILEDLTNARAARVRIRECSGSGALGRRWLAENTDWEDAQSLLTWIVGLHKAVGQGDLPAGLLVFFADECSKLGLDGSVAQAQSDRHNAQEAVRRVLERAQLDRDPAAFTELPIAVQRDRIANWLERLDDLQSLIRYNSLANDASEAGLDESVALSQTWPGANTRLVEAFERSWYTGIVREAVEARPALARFDRKSHEEIVEEFRQLDDLSLRYNRTKVALAHWRSVPRGTAGGAMGWLNIQFNLRQNHKPIRNAMEKAGEAVQAIKPVFLMSPLSVAMYLPALGPRFDLVIFDEASQVKPEDAFGGILRAQQTIVVGDSKQMPPTSFFDKLTTEAVDDDDEEEADDLGGSMKELESVLAMMSSKLPERSPRRRDLRWHYRSRHDALIATSNRLFYKDKLVVFPSPWRTGPNSGLLLRHDPKTIYDRGGSRKNVGEARSVALAAMRHVLEHPKLTLGIAAFSKAQQEAIQDELDLLRREETAFASFDAIHPFEPLFVKNLENIQGDERDVIFISVGYGRDEHGFIPASFGPLNREGGERRLNVLITRARVRCEIFTNLKSDEMRLTDNPSRGVLALKTFLAFADTGSLDVPAATGKEPQSLFEESVLDRLRAQGYDVEPQVGSCNFYIDLAVRHPEQPQRFVLGIECDGAMYHSSRTARDRDKLRQQVLENRGWRLHRIWSTDWFNNSDREFERLVQAIQAAIARTTDDIDEESARPSEFVDLERDEDPVVKDTIAEYSVCNIRIDLGGIPLHNVLESQLAGWISDVVTIESPIHIDEVVRRIREAAGVAKAGNRISAAMEYAASLAERQGRVVRRDDFLYDPAQAVIPIRSRAHLPPQARRLELVSPEESTEAILRVVKNSFGIEAHEAMFLAVRLLGFERITSGMADRLRNLIDLCVSQGKIESNSGLLRIASSVPASESNVQS